MRKLKNNLKSLSKRGENNPMFGKNPWNKGTKGIMKSNQTSFKPTGYTFKGTKSEYKHLHYWINKEMGKANSCSFNPAHVSSRFEWANVSYSYLLNIDDWIPLCKKCHYEYDKVRRGDVYA